jgi:hypothetical protein
MGIFDRLNPEVEESNQKVSIEKVQTADEEKTPENDVEKDSQEEQSKHPREFEAHISVYPESTSDLPFSETEIFEQIDEKRELKVFSGKHRTAQYQYKNVRKIKVDEENIRISPYTSQCTINYDDIVDAKILSGRGLDTDPSTSSNGCEYLRIILSKIDCPHCDNFSGFLSDVINHIETDHGKKIDTDDIKSQDHQLFYLYFLGSDHSIFTGGNNDHAELINKPDTSGGEFEALIRNVNSKSGYLDDELKVLIDWIEKPGELRIEGLTKGSSTTTGKITGDTDIDGASRGIQIGPFTREKSKSQGSIQADIRSNTSDNTFTSDVDFLQIDRNGIYVKSDPVIDIEYSEIERVSKRNNGIFVEIGQQTYSINGYGHFMTSPLKRDNLDAAFGQIESKIGDKEDTVANTVDGQVNEQTPAEKIEDLNQLYQNNIISKEEFESKKTDLLDEF